MKVELLQNSSLAICASAVRTCWQSQDKSDSVDGICGPNDAALVDRVGNKFKHASTLEHLTYTFYISGVSRALLQELARHRMASPSVKSTRYTLKELKEETPFFRVNGDFDELRARKYLVFTGNSMVDRASVEALEQLRRVVNHWSTSNDQAKYCLPESYKTELTWTINARSLQNFLHLRSSKSALWEIRDLALEIFAQIPPEHKFLFEGSISDETTN